MRLLKQATTPLAVSLAIILVVTAVLFYFKSAQHHHHLVFFYLFPIALVAMLYGSVLSMVCATFAILVAAFFLYDPIYSLYVSDARDVGELILFCSYWIDRSQVHGGTDAVARKAPLSLRVHGGGKRRSVTAVCHTDMPTTCYRG